MEIPVMTSASTHRLRSACADTAHPYLNSSHYAGGCLKKVIDAPSFLNKLNIAEKRSSINDRGVSRNQTKNLSNRSCSHRCHVRGGGGVGGRNRNGRLENANVECFGGNMSDNYSRALLGGFSNGLNLPNDILTKFKSSGSIFNGKPKGCRVGGEAPLALHDDDVIRKVNHGNANSCNGTSDGHGPTAGNDLANGSAADSGTAGYNNIRNDNDDNNNRDHAGKEKSIGAARPEPDAGKLARFPDSDPTQNADGNGRKKVEPGASKWEPKHLMTRRTARISREVYRVWQARVGSSSHATADQVRLLLRDLQLFPAECQELLHKIAEGTGRKTASMRVSIDEICRLLAANRRIAGLIRASPAGKLIGKDGNYQQIRGSKKSARNMCKYEVFLGGSCNPTTWRTEIAIPDLEKMGITYFNPQVPHWRPELLEVEYHAKENAAVLFFVIDNQTRGISALIEVAHVAASKRKKLILVIQSYTMERQNICGEVISQEEYEDLKNGQEVLQDIVQSQGIPIFDNISVALKCTERVVKENFDLKSAFGYANASARGDSAAIEPREAFEALVTAENGKLTLKEACKALRMLTSKSFPINYVTDLVESKGESTDKEELQIGLEQFCSLARELEARCRSEQSLQGGSECLHFRIASGPSLPPIKDVFLGGTYKDTSWKEEIAIPLLKKNGLSFFNPKISERSRRFSPIEATSMNNSYILLIVITNSARSIAEMAVAGHYMGLGARMVLCVQHFPDDVTIGVDKLSENAIKDYNRGRIYLTDIARKSGVAIYGNVTDAVNRVIEECKNR